MVKLKDSQLGIREVKKIQAVEKRVPVTTWGRQRTVTVEPA